MKVIYTGEEIPEKFSKSLFLAGGSLRPGQEKEMESWRVDAIKHLEDMGYNGLVFCPENRDGKFEKDFSYDNQIAWEEKHLNIADCIVFWVPRNLSLDSDDEPKLPCFTTNIEWGAWADSGKVVLGAPEDAEKMSYLKHYAEEFKVPFSDTLTATLREAMDKLGEGAERVAGERFVPLFIWNLQSFQNWYRAQTDAGNTLNHAGLLYSFRPKYSDFVFLWILKVSIHIEAEDRDKDNEFVLARPDISSVCLYHFANNGETLDTEFVLVKEFRSPASTKDGFIREFPGGSSFQQNINPIDTAAEEVFEETGFNLDPSRLKPHSALQLSGTLSSHKAHLYSVELTDEEIEWFKSQEGVVHGNEDDSERTFIEVLSLSSLINDELTDWTTLGMILSVIQSSLSA